MLTRDRGLPWASASEALPQIGLSCDTNHLRKMVTAEGRLLHVSATAHADLFWAIRGGAELFGSPRCPSKTCGFPWARHCWRLDLCIPTIDANRRNAFYLAFSTRSRDEPDRHCRLSALRERGYNSAPSCPVRSTKASGSSSPCAIRKHTNPLQIEPRTYMKYSPRRRISPLSPLLLKPQFPARTVLPCNRLSP